MVFEDVYFQPHAPDPVLDENVVVAVARRHAHKAGKLLWIDESGGEARVYFLAGDVVVKTQRPHRLRTRTSLAKEALFLEELDRQVDLPVPRVLGHGVVEGTEYLCLTRIEGTAIERAGLTPEARRPALREVGRTLRVIHAIDQSVLAGSELVPGDRSSHDLWTRISRAFARLGTALDHDPRFMDVVDVPKLAAERLDLTPEDVDPVTVHSNPRVNSLVDSESGAFTGLIDFGDSYRSHPAFDFRPWPLGRDAEAVLEGYQSVGPLPPGFEDVWRTVLVIEELGDAARGSRSPAELEVSLDRLLA